MTKLDIVLAVLCVIGLAFSVCGVADAKWAGDIDLLYNRFIITMFLYGALILLMKKN